MWLVWHFERSNVSVIIGFDKTIESLDLFFVRIRQLYILELLLVLSKAYKAPELIWLRSFLLLHGGNGSLQNTATSAV